MLKEKIDNVTKELEEKRVNLLEELNIIIKDNRYSDIYKNEKKLEIPNAYTEYVQKANEEKDKIILDYCDKNEIKPGATDVILLNSILELIRKNEFKAEELKVILFEHRKNLLLMRAVGKIEKLKEKEELKEILLPLQAMELINWNIEKLKERLGLYYPTSLSDSILIKYTIMNDSQNEFDKIESNINGLNEMLDKWEFDGIEKI